ncbi:MAG: DUF4038 domain-containing protein [Planctomycetales bacterium]|nr:DUF4038 domain-containing protein [Planctomycetales bacterium]
MKQFVLTTCLLVASEVLISVGCFSSDVYGQHRGVIIHGDSQSKKVQRWDVVDLTFSTTEASESFVDEGFSAVFEHESGKAVSVLGFFDGGNHFVIRFCPDAAGEWKYQTQSSLRDLDELSGQLSVQVAGDERHGPVVINSDDPTHFHFADGKRYYPIAFESDWLFALDADNADGIPGTRTLVDSLAENGFNQIVMNVFAYDVTWDKDPQLDSKYDFGSPTAFPFSGSNAAPDFSQINVEYFQRLDRVIDYLDEKGIAAHLMIYVWNKRVNWPEAESDGDNRYFDYVVKRYQAYPNLIWDVSKEALGYGHNDVNYITRRIERLRKLDAHDRLVTVHAYSYCRQFPEQIDFVSVQTWESELCRRMLEIASEFPNKPILNIEHGGYERGRYTVFNGNYTSPETCLERAYLCVFAGTYPTHYWQNAAWNVIIPNASALSVDEQPRLEYYKYLRDFVDKYEVEKLIAGEKKSNAGFSLHDGKAFYLYLVPAECEFLNLRPRRDLGNTMRLTWFNPRTGKYGEPFTMPMTEWPFVDVPQGEGFHILICELEGEQ